MGADGGRELREFIRRLGVNDDRIRALERQAAGLRTGIRDLWAFGGGGGGYAITSFHGNVGGCPPVIGGIEAVLTVRDQSTGAVVATIATDPAGAFGPTPLLYRPPAQTFDLVVSPTSGRLGPLATTFNVTFAFTFILPSCPPATGDACWSPLQTVLGIPFPIAATLDVVDSRFGSGTITRGAWAGTGTGDWTTPATFPAVPMWDMQDTQRFFLTTVGGVTDTLADSAITAFTAPSATVKMSITWTAPAGHPLYTAGDTVTVSEP